MQHVFTAVAALTLFLNAAAGQSLAPLCQNGELTGFHAIPNCDSPEFLVGGAEAVRNMRRSR